MPILNMSKKNLNRMAKKPEGQSYLSFYRQAMSQVAVHKKKKTLAQDHGTAIYWLSVLCLLI